MYYGSFISYISYSNIFTAAVAEGVEQPVADVQSGRLMGKIIRGKQLPSAVQAFLGIPYAQPPVGDLRLALPEPVTPWEGTRDATEYGNFNVNDGVRRQSIQVLNSFI